MQKIYHWILLLAVLLSACSRELLPPDLPGDPVFTAEYQVAAQAYTLNAGVDSQYLFTTYQTDNFGVVLFRGSFADVDCPEALCPGNLTFEFRNDQSGNMVSPDTVFQVGERLYSYPVTVAGDTIWRTTFSTPDSLDYQLFQWQIDNTSPVAGKSITRNFIDNSVHKVTLSAFKNGAVKSVVSRTIVPVGSTLDFPTVNITITPDTAQGYTLTANTSGSQVTTYFWNTGDSTAFIEVNDISLTYFVEVVDQNSNTASAQITLIDQNDFSYKTADFNFSTQVIPPPPPDLLQLGSVQVRWIDAAGGIWTSGSGFQSPDAYFQVIDSEPYALNENGEKTRKMTVSFSCKLFNNTGQSLPVTGTAVIAVAHP